ncbi:hypothetical protein PM082_018558 [Marasmius tenuissimus]|nr:hypothetical protein PM082_018558 [Marasmius tenuissimus]
MSPHPPILLNLRKVDHMYQSPTKNVETTSIQLALFRRLWDNFKRICKTSKTSISELRAVMYASPMLYYQQYTARVARSTTGELEAVERGTLLCCISDFKCLTYSYRVFHSLCILQPIINDNSSGWDGGMLFL